MKARWCWIQAAHTGRFPFLHWRLASEGPCCCWARHPSGDSGSPQKVVHDSYRLKIASVRGRVGALWQWYTQGVCQWGSLNTQLIDWLDELRCGLRGTRGTAEFTTLMPVIVLPPADRSRQRLSRWLYHTIQTGTVGFEVHCAHARASGAIAADCSRLSSATPGHHRGLRDLTRYGDKNRRLRLFLDRAITWTNSVLIWILWIYHEMRYSLYVRTLSLVSTECKILPSLRKLEVVR